VQKTVRKFGRLAEAEKADREFYKKLSGHQRLQILVELLNQAPEQRIERVFESLNCPGIDSDFGTPFRLVPVAVG
jgi:hypothetical protein